MLSAIAQTLSGSITSFDLHTTLQNGFCFGRFNLGATGTTTYLSRPLLQVGKFIGEFPFIVQTSGVYKQEAFSITQTVIENEAFAGDSVAAKIWAGNYIENLQSDGAGGTEFQLGCFFRKTSASSDVEWPQ
jgi:Ca-activated chloride channel family protein